MESSCESSSIFSVNDKCDNIFSKDTNKEWVSADEGVGAWLKINFKYEIELFRLDLMQLYSKSSSWENVTIDFGGNRNESFTLKRRKGAHSIDEAGKEWDYLFFEPVNTTYIIIKFTSYYEKNDNGMKRVRPIGKKRKGLVMKNGYCLNNDLNIHFSTKLYDCEILCGKNIGCVGFVYNISDSKCILKNSTCTTLIQDDNVNYFEWSNSIYRFTIRNGLCNGNPYLAISNLNFNECHNYAMNKKNQNLRAWTYSFKISTCILVEARCPTTNIVPDPEISFHFIGKILSFLKYFIFSNDCIKLFTFNYLQRSHLRDINLIIWVV